MSRMKKLSPGTFASQYLPMKAERKTTREICKLMGISTRTLNGYLHDPAYRVQIDMVDKTQGERAESKGRKIVDLTLDEGLKQMEEYKAEGSRGKVLALGLKLAPMVKTEAELIRCAQAVVQVAIDARQQGAIITEGAFTQTEVDAQLDELERRLKDVYLTRIRELEAKEGT